MVRVGSMLLGAFLLFTAGCCCTSPAVKLWMAHDCPGMVPEDAPRGLTATVEQKKHGVKLRWDKGTDPARKIDRYFVERRADAEPFRLIGSTRESWGQDFWDENPMPGRTYTYRIKGKNPCGESPLSTEVTVRVPQWCEGMTPVAPAGLRATVEGNMILVTWTSDDRPDKFTIEKRFVSGGPFFYAGEVGTHERRDALPASGAHFTYRVRAENPCGKSGWSDEVTF